MRRTIMTVGDLQIDEIPNPRGGYIAGRLEVIDTKTKETVTGTYRITHNNKTDKWSVMSKLIKQLKPENFQNKEEKI